MTIDSDGSCKKLLRRTRSYHFGHGFSVVDAAEQSRERCTNDEGRQSDGDRDLRRHAHHDHVGRVQPRPRGVGLGAIDGEARVVLVLAPGHVNRGRRRGGRRGDWLLRVVRVRVEQPVDEERAAPGQLLSNRTRTRQRRGRGRRGDQRAAVILGIDALESKCGLEALY